MLRDLTDYNEVTYGGKLYFVGEESVVDRNGKTLAVMSCRGMCVIAAVDGDTRVGEVTMSGALLSALSDSELVALVVKMHEAEVPEK